MLKFTSSGIYCEPGDFYIDPWRPVDRAIITHGHGDHAKYGMKSYLCHHYSVPILKSRLGEDIQVQGIGYSDPLYINQVKVSLHPAGHIVGSAQVRMEYQGRVTVISGDYKVQNDGLSTPFEPVRCHEFITESTFGLPIYKWKSIDEQHQELRNWVKHNQAIGKTSVFVGYSLGKAQRIMQALDGMGELNVHYAIGKLNEAYESVGIRLPEYTTMDLRLGVKDLDQKIIIVPPSLIDNPTVRKIPNMVYAICSGWMHVRGARRWRSADAGFAISDHADWPGLLDAIQATGAEKVFVTHGQTAVFSKYLNEIGIESQEVKTEFGNEEDSEVEQQTA
jgi:putative mRNA 3-end processing factor